VEQTRYKKHTSEKGKILKKKNVPRPGTKSTVKNKVEVHGGGKKPRAETVSNPGKSKV